MCDFQTWPLVTFSTSALFAASVYILLMTGALHRSLSKLNVIYQRLKMQLLVLSAHWLLGVTTSGLRFHADHEMEIKMKSIINVTLAAACIVSFAAPVAAQGNSANAPGQDLTCLITTGTPGSFNDTDVVDSKWLPRKAADEQASKSPDTMKTFDYAQDSLITGGTYDLLSTSATITSNNLGLASKPCLQTSAL